MQKKSKYLQMCKTWIFANIQYAAIFQLIMADCRYQYMRLFWFPPNCREQFSQASPVVELTYSYPYSYCVGPVADVDVQCFAKHTHSLSKTRRLLSQQFVSCVHNQRVILGQC